MGSKRVGLARMQALIENLKRTLDWNGAEMTDVASVTTTGTVTVGGNFKASAHVTGAEGCVHSATIEATGAAWASGALSIPAHAIITDVGVVVTTQLASDSGTWALKAGDAAGEADIAASVANALSGASATVAVGKGTNTHTKEMTAMGGNAIMVITADKAYGASARDIHLTLTANGGTVTAGKCRFWVRYLHIEGQY